MKNWMIYGANGYTGALIAREAKRRGLSPILAGRNRASCEALARELDLEWRSFPCESAEQIADQLRGVNLVLHCAGPFSSTSEPMFEACLKAKAHYLDITGEISVFENIHSQADRIRAAGIVALPGVGFDVVPSDCLAAMLKEKLPNASRLTLAFKSSGKLSPGTAKTMIEGLGGGGAIRASGKIENVPAAYSVRKIRFTKREQLAVTIPWGDVSTAFYSTGIPNIQVFTSANPKAIRFMKLSSRLSFVLATRPAQRLLKKAVDHFVHGPSDEDRSTLHCILWGEATADNGARVEARLKVPEGYALTVQTALAVVERVNRGEVAPGAWTPSQAFGSGFIMNFKGVETLS